MMTNLLLKLGTQDMFTGIVKGKGTLIIKLRGSQYALGEDITENIEVEKI